MKPIPYKAHNLANAVTAMRIVLSASLILLRSNKTAFIIVYLVCGMSDVLDGYIARKTHTESKLGEKLDSIADFVLYSVVAVILYGLLRPRMPQLAVPLATVVVLRLAAYLVSAIKYHAFVFLHTILNKITGFLVFLSPLMVMNNVDILIIYAVVGVAGLAAIEEMAIHLTTSEADANRLSIFVR